MFTSFDNKVSEVSKTRESLIEAQTSRRHLEEKIEDLTRQMQGNVEKLSVYERRPSTTTNAMAVDQDGTREQQLEAEVAELRSALKMAEVDLAAAKTHRDQYQEISQSNETALASLNATFDEYKASTEAQIARHEVRFWFPSYSVILLISITLVRAQGSDRQAGASQL
jgi:nucleoprotein TPR